MINVAKLRAKIEAHIDAAKGDHQRQVDEWEAFVVRDKAKWLERYGDDWLEAGQRVRDAISRGDVITPELLPGRSDSVQLWSMPYRDDKSRRRPDGGQYRAPAELVQVLNALALLDETEISHTALSKVGITPTVMGAVSRYLSQGYVR